MKINTLNKTIIAAMMALSLAACSNDTGSQSVAAENQNIDQAVSQEQTDLIDSSVEEKSENNKPAQAEEIKDEKETVIDVKKAEDKENTKEDTSNKENPTSKEENKADQAVEEEIQSPSTGEAKAEDDVDYQQRDGSYITNLVASKEGVRDEQMGLASIKDISINGNTLRLDASLDYLVDPTSYDNAEEYDNGSYYFQINENTKFQAVGGLAEPEIFNAQEFVDYYQGVKDSGLGLKIEVKDGLVTTVSIAS